MRVWGVEDRQPVCAFDTCDLEVGSSFFILCCLFHVCTCTCTCMSLYSNDLSVHNCILKNALRGVVSGQQLH